MLEFFDLANNPIFVKHFRSRLRRPAVIPALLLIFIASSIIVVIDSKVRDNQPTTAIGSQMFFWLQMFLLIVIGGSQIASAIAQVRDSGILDYHRLTPIPSAVQTIGFLVGAPIREYILYLVTFPFALYCAIVSEIGISDFAKLFMVQVAVVLMSHSMALITGLASRSARGASGTFIVIAMILNGAAIQLYEAGVYGPSLLSSYPVYEEVFLAKERAKRQAMWQQWQGAAQQPNPPVAAKPLKKQGQLILVPPPGAGMGPAPQRQVTFFGAELPVVLQSMFFQGTFLTFLFIAASRRIRSARIPMLSKKQVLLFLGSAGFLTMGSLWSDPHQLEVVVGSLYFMMILALILTALTTPDQGDFSKGLQRSHRLLNGQIPFWHDLTSTKWMVPIIGLLAVLPAVIRVIALPAPPPPRDNVLLLWAPIATTLFTILSFGFARQAIPLSVGKRWTSMFALYIVLVWGMPVAFGGVANALGMHEAIYVMVISPMLGVVASSRLAFADFTDQTAMLLLSMVPPVILTLLFFSMLATGSRRIASAVIEEQQHRYPKMKEVA